MPKGALGLASVARERTERADGVATSSVRG